MASSAYPDWNRNQEATVWVGGLDPQVSEEVVWELMLQAGPVVSVHLPKDKVTSQHQGYGFCEFRTPEDAQYAIRVLNMIKLFGKPIRVNKASKDKQEEQDIGANLFIGNLDYEVDEKTLFDTFSAFGNVTSAKVMMDQDSGEPRGFGFVSFDSFDSSDHAIESMNGQWLCNKQVNVSYAYKKDGTKGERHGSQAERLLAANRQAVQPQVVGSTSTSASRSSMMARAPPLPPPPTSMMTNSYGGMGGGGSFTAPPPPPPPPSGMMQQQHHNSFMSYPPPPPPPPSSSQMTVRPPPMPNMQQQQQFVPPPPPPPPPSS